MKPLSNPFSLESIGNLLSRLADKQPQVYYTIAVLVTLTGMFFLALFPLLTLIGSLNVLGGISSATGFGDWLGVFVWLMITGTAGLITTSMFLAKTQMPSGLGLKEDKSPRLHELINEIGENYKVPRIDRIIVHDYSELEMLSVPRFGIPLLNTNVLYIGLPVMQTLSPQQFKGVLARKLGQFSAEHNRKTHWIYRWRQYCAQYLRTYKRSKSAMFLPLKWFFKFYTPVLNAFTTLVARQDELEADVYALQLLADSEMADVILRQTVANEFLKSKYWPRVYDLQRKAGQGTEHLPHQNMANVLRKNLTENTFAQLMKELINAEPRWNDPHPGLLERLEHIGQTRLDLPPPVMETAAQRYLGDAYAAVIKLLDKQWLAKKTKHGAAGHDEQDTDLTRNSPNGPETMQPESAKSAQKKPATATKQASARKASSKKLTTEEIPADLPADERQFRLLKQKAASSRLNQNEAFEFATLAEKFEGKAVAISMYQKILKQDPKHAKTLFAVGRILLSQNDPSGVKILEKAMQFDKGVVAQGCWMLAKYFKAIGDEERSRSYLEKAASVSAAA